MAKKTQPAGPGVGMIVTLVFFVLASVILGVTTWLGFDGQKQLEDEAKKANEAKKNAETRVAEETTRRNIERIANGVEDPENREDLIGASKSHASVMLEEYTRLTNKLGAAGTLPGNKKDGFYWQLVVDAAAGGADGEKKPAAGPAKTIPQIAKQWYQIANDFKSKYEAEVNARKKAEAEKTAADKRADDQKDAFDAEVTRLGKEVKDKINAMDVAFQDLKKEADKKGLDFKNFQDTWSNERVKLEDALADEKKKLAAKIEQFRREMNNADSDLLNRFKNLDPVKIAERMGRITDQNGEFVTIRFDAKLGLVPGQSFVVIPSNGSLIQVIEKEKELEKKHHTYSSYLTAREPFSDNEFIKGMVEITDVTGADTARARITYQPSSVRNPITKSDQLFNIALSTNEKEHVAFVGIIDLDGDGLPNNEEFIRILEKNNLIVDAYLDLKTGEVRKRDGGISYRTKFLIVGTDAPLVGKVKEMVETAKEKGIQTIDARRFLALIGVKPPKSPAVPEYSKVQLGGDGSKNPGDPDAPPMPPKDEPKKDKDKDK
jgi:cell division protein FtsB